MLLLLGTSWATPSSAWQLFDHRLLTQRGVQLYTRCYAQHFAPTELKMLIAGNLSEDYNLAVKWLKNSHYYNPNKWVRTLYRDDAAYRVQYLLEKLSRAGQPQLHLLGKIIHFVQDVASPPHVMPIVHGLRDGFESFKLAAVATIDLDQPCPPSTPAAPPALLKREARRTLASTRDTAIAQKNGRRYEFSWQLFWSEGLGSRFGYYGFFGNNFGQTRPIVIMGHTYRFQREIFQQYKLQRAQQAIAATAETLHWYQQQRATP